jgi:hypothetical protein
MDTSHQRIFRHDDVGPYGAQNLVFGKKPPGVPDEQTQDIERLGSEFDLMAFAAE